MAKKKDSPPDPAARAAAATDPATTTVDPTTGPTPPAGDTIAEAVPAKLGKSERLARTWVKYDGVWYEPGQPVPFKSAKVAEPYDASRALQPK